MTPASMTPNIDDRTWENGAVRDAASPVARAVHAPGTWRQLLQDAGISASMKVLVTGASAVDVARIAADVVGPDGLVIAIGTDAAGVNQGGATEERGGRGRCFQRHNVRFIEGSIRTIPLPDDFDAVVGQGALLGAIDPVDELRRLASHVRPWGVLAFEEFDGGAVDAPAVSGDVALPAHYLAARLAWTGYQLLETFAAAGLGAPVLSLRAPSGFSVAWADDYGADSFRVFLPHLQERYRGAGGLSPNAMPAVAAMKTKRR